MNVYYFKKKVILDTLNSYLNNKCHTVTMLNIS